MPTLSEELTDGRLAVPEVLRQAQGLEKALRSLHESGLVHGAVTPSNLYLAREGLELAPPTGGRSFGPG
ncbi:MAG TPA: hypothetical protein VKB88_40410 [Bryobacteraceae bacterium]|nr:hypothetical protein [Bryobacteraceae bacterium]